MDPCIIHVCIFFLLYVFYMYLYICILYVFVVFIAEGQVSFHVYHLQDSPMVDQFNVRDDEHHAIRLSNGTTVDMPTGRVTVDASSRCLPEDLTLAFCVGTLFVTCQKKPMSMVPGMTNGSVRSSRTVNSESDHVVLEPRHGTSRFNKKLAKNKKMSRKRKMSASFTYLLACGLQIDAALYGSMGPSLASSRASSVSNLLKSASEASLPVTAPTEQLEPEPVKVSALSPVEVTSSPVDKPVGKPVGEEDRPVTGGNKPVTDGNKPLTNGSVPPAADGSVDNPAVVPDSGIPDSPQNYMDVRL